MKHFLQTAILALVVTLTFSSCETTILGENKKVQTNQKVFDMDQFQDNVEAGLGPQWVGYSYVINQNGQAARTGAFGLRRGPNDGNVAQSIAAPIYGASINKTITAVALLKVLDEYGNLTASEMLNANVYNFLPSNWVFGPNTTNISFKDLLRHESGIDQADGTSFASLRTLFAGGVSPNDSYEYSNANYALIRVLIGMMTGSIDPAKYGDNAYMETAINRAFRRYLDQKLFKPLNITVDTKPFGASPALYYRFGNLNTNWDLGDRSHALGQGGYYICSRDMAKLLAYVNHADQILTPNARKAMYDYFLGWSDGGLPENEPQGDYGAYYYKGGAFCNSTQNGSCTGMGVRNIIAVFPKNGVELVIMANSRGGSMDNSSSLRAMVRNAYDNAWISN